MINTYTLEVYKKGNKPCVVVTIKHIMRSGVFFFNNIDEAIEYVKKAKEELGLYAKLEYNSNGVTDESYANLIKMVLSCDNIHISKDGKTYYEEKQGEK